MNVILCGYHWAGCKALELLRAMNHNVYVFTHEAPYHVPSMVDYCKKTGTPYSLENISKVELPFVPDVICSIYYRHIIKKHVIESCKGKIFNLHPSLLPKYRGCSSLTWAMVNGERETGYTYHYIDAGTDTGDILVQDSLVIEEFDTQETLYLKAMFESMSQFSLAFEKVAQGLPGKKQEGTPSYYPRGCPHDGQIDSNWDETYKERFIRAMIYPPYPVAKLGEREIFTIRDLANS
jgi:methionyl-tRNA formyltransferase